MPDSILIPPDNRLLGWSLNDLTMYGAPSLPGMAIGRAADTAPLRDLASSPIPADTPAPAPSESDVAARETTALLDDSVTSAPALSPSAAPASLVVPAQVDSAPAIPAPTGAGSFIDSPLTTPLQIASPPIDATPAATSAPAALPDGVPGLSSAIPIIDGVGTVLPDIAAFAPVGSILDTLTGDTAPALSPLTGTVDALIGDVGPLADSVTGALPAVQALVDGLPLDGFGGSDPAAGITTLIGMVESADMFDLGQAVAAPVTAVASGSILDSLTADAMPEPLLGDAHDGVGAAIDDHGIHIGL